MNFREYITEEASFDLKVLIKILNTEGYSSYKNKTPNRMHEYHNKGIIISLGGDNGITDNKKVTSFRIRDFDVKNGARFTPKDIKEFTKMIRNKTLKDARKAVPVSS